jgi:hypothetical protein
MHRLALLLFPILLAACGAGSDAPTATFGPAVQTRLAEADPVRMRTPRPTTTPRNSSKPGVVITPESTAESAGPTKTPLPTPTLHPAAEQFATVLLDVQDLPTGWTIIPAELRVEAGQTSEVCGVLVADYASIYVQGDYEKSVTGPFISEGLSLYASATEADFTIANLEQAFMNCPPEGYSDVDYTTVFAPLAFPQVGDRSFAFRLTLLAGDLAVEMDVVYAQVDKVIVSLGYGTLSGFGDTIDSTQTETFTRSAEAKVRSMLDFINTINAPSTAL